MKTECKIRTRLRFRAAVRVRMPLTSAAMPCVLPWQPPVKTTLRIVSPSSSMSICREQVPRQV